MERLANPPTIERARIMREFVKLYRDGERFGMTTNIRDEAQFVRQVATTIGEALENVTLGVRREVMLAELLPQVVDICSDLRGYKAPLVDKQIVLTTGRFYPSDTLLIAAREGNGVAKALETVDG